MARIYLKRTLTGFAPADEPSQEAARKIVDRHGRNPARVSIGQIFGRLTVVRLAGVGRDRQRRYVCKCACSNEVEVRSTRLTGGRTKSCGCLRLKNEQNVKHGFGRVGKKSRTYRIWMGMRHRCNNPRSRVYKYYGGRGIRVCDRWNDFTLFLKDMGQAPEGMSIDRYPDNDGNYEPGNCRWATRSQQTANRRPYGAALSS